MSQDSATRHGLFEFRFLEQLSTDMSREQILPPSIVPANAFTIDKNEMIREASKEGKNKDACERLVKMECSVHGMPMPVCVFESWFELLGIQLGVSTLD